MFAATPRFSSRVSNFAAAASLARREIDIRELLPAVVGDNKTGHHCPSARIATSPTASSLPSLINRASAMRSRAGGFVRKLIVRLVVTASGTQPIADNTGYIAKSPSAIIVAPETAPRPSPEGLKAAESTSLGAFVNPCLNVCGQLSFTFAPIDLTTK
jgi:hypothetical protein